MAGGKIRKERPKQGGGTGSTAKFQGGLPFHKSKGQHILKNPLLIDTIIQKSGILPTDIILEIGPGTGNLTKKLLDAGKYVIAVEIDSCMVQELQRRFQGTPSKLRKYYIIDDCHRKFCFRKMSKYWRGRGYMSEMIARFKEGVKSASVEVVARNTRPANVHSLDVWAKFVKFCLSPNQVAGCN